MRPSRRLSGARDEGIASRRMLEARRHQLAEGGGAVADAVLLLGIDLAEGAGVAVGLEHRVVAEALAAARRPNQRAMGLASEHLDVADGPRECQDRHEV